MFDIETALEIYRGGEHRRVLRYIHQYGIVRFYEDLRAYTEDRQIFVDLTLLLLRAVYK